MIAIGSNIGTGLFIGMGAGLKNGGPAALIIAFSLISVVIYLMMSSLAGNMIPPPSPKGPHSAFTNSPPRDWNSLSRFRLVRLLCQPLR